MPFVIRLDADLEDGLRRLSAEEQMPQAEIVRQLIRERVATGRKRKSAFDIAMEMGVVGIDSDPRKDLAENHSRHLKRVLRAKRPA
jgi:hypothetical protein